MKRIILTILLVLSLVVVCGCKALDEFTYGFNQGLLLQQRSYYPYREYEQSVSDYWVDYYQFKRDFKREHDCTLSNQDYFNFKPIPLLDLDYIKP